MKFSFLTEDVEGVETTVYDGMTGLPRRGIPCVLSYRTIFCHPHVKDIHGIFQTHLGNTSFADAKKRQRKQWDLFLPRCIQDHITKHLEVQLQARFTSLPHLPIESVRLLTNPITLTKLPFGALIFKFLSNSFHDILS